MRNRQLYLTINPCRVLGSSCQCSNRTRPSAAKPYICISQKSTHTWKSVHHTYIGQVRSYFTECPPWRNFAWLMKNSCYVIENSCAMRNIMLHFTKGYYSIEGHILPLRVLQAITNWASKSCCSLVHYCSPKTSVNIKALMFILGVRSKVIDA